MLEDRIYLYSQPQQIFYWESGVCAHICWSGGQERDADSGVFHLDSVTSSGTEINSIFQSTPSLYPQPHIAPP